MSVAPTATQKSESRAGLLWTALLAAYALVILFPVIWMALMAVKPADVMFARPTVWLFVPTLDHFAYVIQQNFHQNLIVSILLSVLSTGLVVLVGTPAAY